MNKKIIKTRILSRRISKSWVSWSSFFFLKHCLNVPSNRSSKKTIDFSQSICRDRMDLFSDILQGKEKRPLKKSLGKKRRRKSADNFNSLPVSGLSTFESEISIFERLYWTQKNIYQNIVQFFHSFTRKISKKIQ